MLGGKLRMLRVGRYWAKAMQCVIEHNGVGESTFPATPRARTRTEGVYGSKAGSSTTQTSGAAQRANRGFVQRKHRYEFLIAFCNSSPCHAHATCHASIFNVVGVRVEILKYMSSVQFHFHQENCLDDAECPPRQRPSPNHTGDGSQQVKTNPAVA